MVGLIEPSPLSEPRRDSNWLPIGLGVALVLLVVGVIAWVSRTQPKHAAAPPPYAANLKLSDLKMSAAQNFVGATVTYLDGTISNSGNQSVTDVMVHIVFQDPMGQVAQVEDLPVHVLQTKGPYPDAVDLAVSPLAPGQSKQFRLTLEHVSANWDQAYPRMEIVEVSTK
jgi:hypothetical protein